MSARILIIDDMIQTLKYLSLYLTKDGFEVTTAKSFDEGLKVLNDLKVDLILLDVMMPDVDGFESCRRLKEDSRFAHIPVIFVTSCDSGDAISQCFDAGGSDYVYKFATQRELLVRVKTQLKLSESLQQEERALALFGKALDVFPHEIIGVFPDGRIIFTNDATRRLIGDTSSINTVKDINDNVAAMLGLNEFSDVISSGEIKDFKLNFGNIIRQITVIPVYDELINQCQFVFVLSQDITEEEEIEMHLRQSKKMESVSMIAGGAAHDLNNILGGMLGYTSMAKMYVDDDKANEFLDKAEDAAEKAAQVISQLLNFAKHKEPKLEVVSLHSLVNDSVKLISSTVNRHRQVFLEKPKDDYKVNVDLNLIQQALINVFTALDKVMGEHSKIKICVSSTFNHDTLLPFREDDILGDFVKIIIVDEENYDQLRDNPINVDVSRNKNLVSGLGVAIVCGIIKDFNGQFYVHGDSQHPTGFTLCLPQISVSGGNQEEEKPAKSKNVKILIVDNEAIFIQMVSDLMDLLGYEATFSKSGDDCLENELERAQEYDLLMIDYGEKDLKPVEVMEAFRSKNPDLKVILVSSRQVEEVSMIADLQECSFLEKPFRMKEFSGLLNSLIGNEVKKE